MSFVFFAGGSDIEVSLLTVVRAVDGSSAEGEADRLREGEVGAAGAGTGTGAGGDTTSVMAKTRSNRLGNIIARKNVEVEVE